MKQTEQSMCFLAQSSEKQKFNCELCEFFTSNKSLYARHETTMKHRLALLKHEKHIGQQTESGAKFTCDRCKMTLGSRTTLWRHRKKCIEWTTNHSSSQNQEVTNKKLVVSAESVFRTGVVGVEDGIDAKKAAAGAGAGAGVRVGEELADTVTPILNSVSQPLAGLDDTASDISDTDSSIVTHYGYGYSSEEESCAETDMDDAIKINIGSNALLTKHCNIKTNITTNTTPTKSPTTGHSTPSSSSLAIIMEMEAEMAKFLTKNKETQHNDKDEMLKTISPITASSIEMGMISNVVVMNRVKEVMDTLMVFIQKQDKLNDQQYTIQNKMIEQQSQLIEQQTQLIEIAQRPTTQNNTVINNFNVLNYLNEEHKDALSIQDFINSIDVTLDDMYYTRDNGYVNGMCNVLVKKIENIPGEYRPIHCTDKKRLKFLVKTKEAWQRDEQNKNIENVMSDITQKHLLCLSEWKRIHPDWMDNEELRDEYLKITMQIMDGQRENGDKKKKAIVKTIGSSVHIGDLYERVNGKVAQLGHTEPTIPVPNNDT